MQVSILDRVRYLNHCLLATELEDELTLGRQGSRTPLTSRDGSGSHSALSGHCSTRRWQGSTKLSIARLFPVLKAIRKAVARQ